MMYLFSRKGRGAKKYPVLFILVLLFVSFPIHALDMEISVKYMPLVFTPSPIFTIDETAMVLDNVVYEYAAGQNMVYQADLKHRSGFNFGFGVGTNSGYDTNDNIVGIISDVFAKIGFKKFFVRVGHLSFPQDILLCAANITGERAKSLTFKRTQVDLVYRFNEAEKEGYMTYYAGLMYQHINEGWVGRIGNSKCIAERSTHGYGIILSMDTFSSAFSRKDSRFFVMPLAEISIILAGMSGTITTPNVESETELASIPIDYRGDASLGIMFGGGNKIKFAAAVGYGYEMGFYQTYHGLVIRGGIKF